MVTCQIVKLTSNKQTEVAFSLNILVLKGLVKTNVNLSFLDILMGQLHWMHPGDCNDHWGGKPLKPHSVKAI